MQISIIKSAGKITACKSLRNAVICLALITFLMIPLPCFGNDPKLQLNPEELTWVKKGHTVRVRIGSYPPLMLSDGKIAGIAIDYLTTIFNRNGIKFSYVQESKVTWPQALKYIEQHDVVDMVPTAKITDDRKKHMLFTNEYIVAPWVIFTRSDADFLSSIDDLKGKTVSVEEGFVIHELLKQKYPEINLKVVSASLEDFAEIPVRDLSTGLVDAYIGNLLSTTYTIQTRGYANVKVAAPTPFGNHNQAMAIRNDWPELVSIINKTLASMTSDQHAAIRNKWLSIRYEYGINKVDILKWILGVSGIASLFIVFVLIWNKRLKTEVVFREKTEKELSYNLSLLDDTNVELKKEIAGHKRSVTALLESEQRLNEAQRMASIGSWIQDLRSNKLTWSDEVFRIFEIDKKISGELFDAFLSTIHPEDRDAVVNAYDDSLKTKKTYEITHRLLMSDGRVKYVHECCKTEYDEGGNPVKSTGTVQDITDKKQAQEEKVQLEAQYRHAQKMESIGRLAGGVAHDFNNALSVIIGFTEFAAKDADPKGQLHEDLTEVLKAAKRATEVTRQLLAFARKQIISPKVLDLNDAVESMLKMIQRLIGEDIDLTWLPGADLWFVKMDPSQIDQILVNLCINCRDAIKGVGKVTIETNTAIFDSAYCAEHAGFIPGEFILLAVSDNGCGIDKEILDSIFEPFFTTKDVDKGTGLGLATVYGIVKQNNGFINVYSEPDKGTTIKIYLSRHRAQKVEIQREPPTEIPIGRDETILLVEDDPSILKLVEKVLKECGYTVLPACKPSEAIDLAEGHASPIHLLVTDVIMPEMNGRKLSEQLQSQYPALKVIFMSGYTANAIAHHGVLGEGMEFIQKPFSKTDLAMIVRKVLDKT